MAESGHPEKSSATQSLLYPMAVSFTVAMATLLLQLVQTRIYSVVFWNHLVYFIISVALLGFGISGTWLAFGPDSRLARLLSLRNAAICFVVTALVSSLLVSQISISIAWLGASFPRTVQLILAYSTALLPYFFGGWMLGSVFRDYAARIHILYFADLVGAGLACLMFLLMIGPLGAIHLVLITCALVAIPPLVNGIRNTSNKVALVGITITLVGLGAFESKINAGIQPEPTKAFSLMYESLEPGDTKNWEFSEWNSISRIDVASAELGPDREQPQLEQKVVFIDGDAWTGIAEGEWWKQRPERDVARWTDYLGPYYFTEPTFDSALIIGTGGGGDVAHALQFGAQSVDAVEINPTTYRLLLEEYLEANDRLLDSPGVRAYNEEGRSFVARTDQLYDVITMTGIDTFAAINSGAYVLSENYLYTLEAMHDYLSHLTDDGILNITRWLHHAETPRLFVVCYETLLRLGIEDPGKHIIVQGSDRATIMIKMKPFSPEEIREYGDHVAAAGAQMYYPEHAAHTVNPLIEDYVQARANGTQDQFFDDLDYDITPVSDDSPFFFHFDKPRTLYKALTGQDIADFVRGQWPSFTLFTLLGFTFIAVVIFMLVPLMRRSHPRVPGFARWLAYFTCLGVSFIFIEIAMMQRFALLLGHPARSLAVVLSSLLIFAGIGSMLRGALNVNLTRALGVLAVMLLLVAYVYPVIIEAALGLSLFARSLLTIALVAPPALIMGMPFPSGLQSVSRHGSDSVAWMWGVNGGSTVLGSILAIIIAIWGSFTLVILTATAGYLLALVLFASLDRKAA